MIGYKGVIPHSYTIAKAKEYLLKDLWVGIAGGSVSWASNANPPFPSKSISIIQDLEAVVYVHTKRLVKLDSLGSITVEGIRYSYVNPSQSTESLVAQQGFYLYLEATIPTDSSLATDLYKILSLLEDVNFINPQPNKEKYEIINASQIVSYNPIWIGTVAPLSLNANELKLQFIREF